MMRRSAFRRDGRGTFPSIISKLLIGFWRATAGAAPSQLMLALI
jgi:hypothetical protein